ncbi:MAG TPA: DUF3048 domain-containing protein [Acidimicrobiales bacterium]|nr:DUF3048 domain-containing protein [Acidimicrobiales bacterium]
MTHPRTPRLAAVLAAATLLTAACGGGDDEAAKPTTTTAPTTTAPPAATPASGAPLTGLAVTDPAKVARPALIVKIDNAPKGRPQEGINQADVVVEEGVEGGITRLAAIFHSQDIGEVGPVRSARSTDIAIAHELQRPLFAYSGANATFQKLVNAAPLINVGQDARPGAYFRKGGRPQTYNLWVRMSELFAASPADATPPKALFQYRGEGEAFAGEPVGGVKMEWRDKVLTAVEWRWDAESATWRRTQNGTAHVDAGGGAVQPKNVVVQFVPYKDTGQRDRSNTVVPEAELVGTGEVWALSDGKVVKGTWSKPALEAPTTYVDGAGQPLKLTPGQTWLELPKPGTGALL